MKISDKIKCEKCGNINEWEYIVPQKLDDFKFEKINDNKVQLREHIQTDDNNYLCRLRCKYCQKIIEFYYPE